MSPMLGEKEVEEVEEVAEVEEVEEVGRGASAPQQPTTMTRSYLFSDKSATSDVTTVSSPTNELVVKIWMALLDVSNN